MDVLLVADCTPRLNNKPADDVLQGYSEAIAALKTTLQLLKAIAPKAEHWSEAEKLLFERAQWQSGIKLYTISQYIREYEIILKALQKQTQS
jgi:hypothetical protein